MMINNSFWKDLGLLPTHTVAGSSATMLRQQEQAARRLLPLNKVLGTENISDLMTKHMPAATILGYLQRMGLEYAEE